MTTYECKTCGWKRENEIFDKFPNLCPCPNCDDNNWMIEGERNNEKWIKGIPVEPGYYWAFHVAIDSDDENEKLLVELTSDGTCFSFGDKFGTYAQYYNFFLGPLFIPPDPDLE